MFGHGKSSVYSEGRMIINKISGPHNEYDATQTINMLRREIENLKGAPFVELVDARDLQGITPEGYDQIQDYYQWLFEKGIVAKAYVTSKSILAEIGKSRVPAYEKINIKVFTDIEEAKSWLLEELHKYDANSVE